jgi:hypothetical protein
MTNHRFGLRLPSGFFLMMGASPLAALWGRPQIKGVQVHCRAGHSENFMPSWNGLRSKKKRF